MKKFEKETILRRQEFIMRDHGLEAVVSLWDQDHVSVVIWDIKKDDERLSERMGYINDVLSFIKHSRIDILKESAECSKIWKNELKDSNGKKVTMQEVVLALKPDVVYFDIVDNAQTKLSFHMDDEEYFGVESNLMVSIKDKYKLTFNIE